MSSGYVALRRVPSAAGKSERETKVPLFLADPAQLQSCIDEHLKKAIVNRNLSSLAFQPN